MTVENLRISQLFKEVTCEVEDPNWRDHPDWQAQLTLRYPKVLRESRTGVDLTFYTNGHDTYYETSGEYDNAGPFLAADRTFSDSVLYDIAVEWFKWCEAQQASDFAASTDGKS